MKILSMIVMKEFSYEEIPSGTPVEVKLNNKSNVKQS